MVKPQKYRPFVWVAITLTLAGPGLLYAREILDVRIKSTGLNDESLNDEHEERACKKFKPTKSQVLRFFKRAKPPEDKSKLLHERYSSCAAEGTIRYTDGSSGQWVLFSSGMAYVTFGDGVVIDLFYRKNGWHDPYACTYGLGDEPEC